MVAFDIHKQIGLSTFAIETNTTVHLPLCHLFQNINRKSSARPHFQYVDKTIVLSWHSQLTLTVLFATFFFLKFPNLSINQFPPRSLGKHIRCSLWILWSSCTFGLKLLFWCVWLYHYSINIMAKFLTAVTGLYRKAVDILVSAVRVK